MDSYSGSLPGETPEETLVREVREELARSVRLVTKIGEAASSMPSKTASQAQPQINRFLDVAGERKGYSFALACRCVGRQNNY